MVGLTESSFNEGECVGCTSSTKVGSIGLFVLSYLFWSDSVPIGPWFVNSGLVLGMFCLFSSLILFKLSLAGNVFGSPTRFWLLSGTKFWVSSSLFVVWSDVSVCESSLL